MLAQVPAPVIADFETKLAACNAEKDQRGVIKALIAQAGGEEVGGGMRVGGVERGLGRPSAAHWHPHLRYLEDQCRQRTKAPAATCTLKAHALLCSIRCPRATNTLCPMQVRKLLAAVSRVPTAFPQKKPAQAAGAGAGITDKAAAAVDPDSHLQGAIFNAIFSG